jgi:hypothetical protein
MTRASADEEFRRARRQFEADPTPEHAQALAKVMRRLGLAPVHQVIPNTDWFTPSFEEFVQHSRDWQNFNLLEAGWVDPIPEDPVYRFIFSSAQQEHVAMDAVIHYWQIEAQHFRATRAGPAYRPREGGAPFGQTEIEFPRWESLYIYIRCLYHALQDAFTPNEVTMLRNLIGRILNDVGWSLS